MSVFISYNHKDSKFVDKLSLALVQNNIKVWKDKWKVSVGDSFINKIQEGIEGASFLCVVFSENSIRSDWVTREINAGLLREVEEKKIVILPIVIDNCKIPLLLRDKLYADFRTDFGSGLKQILAVVGKKYNIDNSGRINNESDYYIDYAIEHGFIDNKFFMNIDVVSFDREEEFSILTQFKFIEIDNPKEINIDEKEANMTKHLLLETCAEEFEANPAHVTIVGNQSISGKFPIEDPNKATSYQVTFKIKRLGLVSANTVLFNVGALFIQIYSNQSIQFQTKKST